MDDTERLIVAREHNKKLLFRIGELESELDEIKDHNKKMLTVSKKQKSMDTATFIQSLLHKLHHKDKELGYLRKEKEYWTAKAMK